jgi:hypothetical protein
MAGLDQAEAPGAGSDDAAKEVASKPLKCPSCGAPYTLRGFSNTKSYACAYCGSILDTTTPEWQVVEKVERKRQEAAIWKLGQRAKFGGHAFELIGWMERFVFVDGTRYSWEEHLFFNPFFGYRYLVYQDGHFQLIEPLPGFPHVRNFGANAYNATYEGKAFRHFTTGVARVGDVVGEFPWRVKRNDAVTAHDFVAPPLMLSCEESDGDVVWSRGTYMTQDEVWAAVAPPARPVVFPRGAYPNQPNPYAAYDWLGKATAVVLALWLFLSVFYFSNSQNKPVGTFDVTSKAEDQARLAADPNGSGTAATPGHHVYELELSSPRDPATVEIAAVAGVDNSWVYCDCALVNPELGTAYPFGVEVSYYHGVEDGESWSEGSRSETVSLGAIPNGKYLLQVERGDDSPLPIRLTITRDVPMLRFPCCSLVLLVIFPLFVLLRRSQFETRRWAESDHAPQSSSSDD